MPILVLSFRYSPDSRALDKAAVEAGWETERMHTWRIPPGLRGRTDIAIYGEHLFAEFLRDEIGLRLTDAPDDFLPSLPDSLRRREIRLMRYEDARRLTAPAFIKPPSFKNFKAAVYASGAELPDDAEMRYESVLVSEPVQWGVEFRCWIVDGEVVDLSAYARGGNLNVSQTDPSANWRASEAEKTCALETVRSVLESGVLLPEAIVVDVGEIVGRGWAVVEANPAWGSGIYGCAPKNLLRVLQKSVAIC